MTHLNHHPVLGPTGSGALIPGHDIKHIIWLIWYESYDMTFYSTSSRLMNNSPIQTNHDQSFEFRRI